MKKTLILVALAIFLFLFNTTAIRAQCPGCAINMGCIVTPAQPTICPAVLPDGVAMQAYNQDLSFYLPANFNDAGSSYNVDLTQLDVLSVTGLPFGLSFQTNAAPSNIYYPTSNPPTSEHGCGKICGTPIMAGTYTITVFVLAHVNVTSLGGLSQTSNSSFQIPLTIQPAAASNNGFSIANPVGCAPLTTTFAANRHSNGNPNYHYSWNFGNGNLSNNEAPPAQTYNTPGNYVASLHTQIDTIPFYYLSALRVVYANTCNDVWPSGDAEYFFVLKQGTTTIYTSGYITQNAPVDFSFPQISLSNTPYSIEIWEDDAPLSNDHCGDFTIQGHTVGTYTLAITDLSIQYTVTHPVVNYDDVDTIKVYQSPIVSPLTFTPNDSICRGDSVHLSVTATFGGIYQWYNDTVAINNATLADYYAKTDGKYYCEVSNTNGCRTNSNMVKITFIDNPTKPGLWVAGSTLNTNLAGVNLQWYFEGTELTGQTGMTYNATATGNYYVLASNSFGCTTSSDTIYFTYGAGIAENAALNGLQLMPNPNNGKFHLQFNTDIQNAIQVRIHDITGRQVYNRAFVTISGQVSEDIDLSGLQKGIYMVEIDAGITKAVSKVIIQ
ncbi:MAG: T9SS type A sorting domain-containing protein [Bacteroidota bacterium]